MSMESERLQEDICLYISDPDDNEEINIINERFTQIHQIYYNFFNKNDESINLENSKKYSYNK